MYRPGANSRTVGVFYVERLRSRRFDREHVDYPGLPTEQLKCPNCSADGGW